MNLKLYSQNNVDWIAIVGMKDDFLSTQLIFYFLYVAGEVVEFEVEIDKRGPGSRSAINVTGPDGVRVIGIPRPPTRPR